MSLTGIPFYNTFVVALLNPIVEALLFIKESFIQSLNNRTQALKMVLYLNFGIVIFIDYTIIYTGTTILYLLLVLAR